MKNQSELFESPFNLAGEPLDEGITPEGEARIRALAESEARKAQACLRDGNGDLLGMKVYPDHDDTNENAL